MLKEKKHLDNIETVRAVGALIVVFYHFIYVSHPSDTSNFLLKNQFLHTWFNIGPQGLNMLFIVSGGVIYFTLLAKEYTLKMFPAFILRRMIRILPPYWLALSFVCLIPLLYNSAYPYSVGDILSNATFSVDLFNDLHWINPVFYTLKLEFIFYIGVGLLAWLLVKEFWIFLLFNGIGIVSAFVFRSDSFLIYLPFFLVGMNLSYYFVNPKDKRYLIGLLTTTLYIAFMYSRYDLLSVLICLGIIFIFRKSPKWIHVLSERSYSLYLTHGISIILVASSLFGKGFSFGYILPITLIFGGIFTEIFYRFIEKPVTKWSKRIR